MEALLVFSADWSSIVVTVVHLWISNIKSRLSRKFLLAETLMFMVLPPLIPTICFFMFLTYRVSTNIKAEKQAHFLAKSVAVINGTFEVSNIFYHLLIIKI